METKETNISVELDESQLAAAIEVAGRLKALPPEKRNDPAVVKEMIEVARQVRDEIRKRRLDLGMPARGEVRSWSAPERDGKPTGSLGIDVRTLIPPSLEELAKKRYLLAVNRIMAGKIDDPSYSVQELADIADVLGADLSQFTKAEDFIASRSKRQP